jgi:outer membrane receptor protein involved in Fe transport
MSLSFDHVYALSNGLILASSLMYNFRGEQNVHDNLDPKMLVDATSRINLRVGLESDRWQVAFVGKNLSDEEMLTYAGNVPLSGSTFGTNSYYGFVDRGRQLALEAGYKF